MWDVAARTSRTFQGHAEEVGALAFSPDGSLLVTANGKENPAGVGCRVGTRIGTATLRDAVKFWDERGTLLSELPKQGAYAWEASEPVGGRMAVADEDGLIATWDVRTGRPITTYRDRGRTESRAIALGRDGTLPVSEGYGRIVAVREDAVPPFAGHSGGTNDIDLSHGTVASAGDDGTVRLRNLDGTALATLDGHSDRVESVSFSPDGARLAALTRDHTISIWDVARRERLSSLSCRALGASTDIAFQPDGRLLISTDPAGCAMLWDLAGNRLERRVSTGQGDVRDVAISHDGTHSGTTLTGHTGPVRAVAFTGEDELVTGADDARIICWSLSVAAAENRVCAEAYLRSEVCGTTRPDS